MTTAADTLTLLRHLLRLTTTPRTGWVDRGVPRDRVESIADHVLMTTLIGWLTADEALDRDRVLKMALVHDLAEAITGDPPPYNRAALPSPDDPDALREFFSRQHVRTRADKAAKDRVENEALETLRQLMPEPAGDEIVALWREYESQQTPEARFAKDLDRFEAFLQARSYARAYPDLPFDGFTDMARHEITNPTLATLRDALLDEEGDQ